VITATAQGRTLKEAVEIAQNVLSNIQFEGMYFRRDIGYEFES
jgi:phosphoribosylamine--glycine ligase